MLPQSGNAEVSPRQDPGWGGLLRVVDGDAPSFEDETGPAYALADGVPYVRGWTDAHRAAEVLRAELRAWGIEGRTAVRAEVVCGGVGVVELGCVSPELAELLAAVLAQARLQPASAVPAPGRAPYAA
ncbi:hypothetical protein [Phytohabitans rumicis]|uniref:hypothetical protein n=1 Tax=Phytohabitans rumicis TaxID=1076125 RepID=UPI0031EE2843